MSREATDKRLLDSIRSSRRHPLSRTCIRASAFRISSTRLSRDITGRFLLTDRPEVARPSQWRATISWVPRRARRSQILTRSCEGQSRRITRARTLASHSDASMSCTIKWQNWRSMSAPLEGTIKSFALIFRSTMRKCSISWIRAPWTSSGARSLRMLTT